MSTPEIKRLEKFPDTINLFSRPHGSRSSEILSSTVTVETSTSTNVTLELSLPEHSSIKFLARDRLGRESLLSKLEQNYTNISGETDLTINWQLCGNVVNRNDRYIELTIIALDRNSPSYRNTKIQPLEIKEENKILALIRKVKTRLGIQSILSVLVFLCIFFISCSKLEDPASVSIDEILKLSRVDTTELRADGVSTTMFLAQIPAEADPKMSTVTFKTNTGSFLGTSNNDKMIPIKADKEGKASATLKMGTTVETVVVSVSISDFVVIKEFELLRAHADKLVGETDNAYVKTDGSVKATLTAILSRTKGSVSAGTEVKFAAIQLNDQNESVNIGRFTDQDKAKTDSNGKAQVKFAADTGDVRVDRSVTITMVTVKDDSTQLKFDLLLQIRSN